MKFLSLPVRLFCSLTLVMGGIIWSGEGVQAAVCGDGVTEHPEQCDEGTVCVFRRPFNNTYPTDKRCQSKADCVAEVSGDSEAEAHADCVPYATNGCTDICENQGLVDAVDDALEFTLDEILTQQGRYGIGAFSALLLLSNDGYTHGSLGLTPAYDAKAGIATNRSQLGAGIALVREESESRDYFYYQPEQDLQDRINNLAYGELIEDTFQYHIQEQTSNGDNIDYATVRIYLRNANAVAPAGITANDDTFTHTKDEVVSGSLAGTNSVFITKRQGAFLQNDQTTGQISPSGSARLSLTATTSARGVPVTFFASPFEGGAWEYAFQYQIENNASILSQIQGLSTGQTFADTFTYTITEGSSSDTATVRIVINGSGSGGSEDPSGGAECGNGGTPEPGEECDDGNVISGDGCNSQCQLEAQCGDGVPESPEQCDDGNIQNGDGCDSSCQRESIAPPVGVCGNDQKEFDEGCDDGNRINGDGCDSNCEVEISHCGNNVEEWDEECDDGNLISRDGCSSTCQTETSICGNGDHEWDEGCDDHNLLSGDGCSSTCETETAECGNFREERFGGETCDDGNQDPGDGCSSDCQVEVAAVQLQNEAEGLSGSRLQPGMIFSYIMSIENVGDQHIQGARVLNQISDQLDFKDDNGNYLGVEWVGGDNIPIQLRNGQGTPVPQDQWSVDGQEITIQLGDLLIGQRVDVRLRVRLSENAEGGAIYNNFRFEADSPSSVQINP